jgi:aminoglycoside phosphotransferase (APT) family kinase protein
MADLPVRRESGAGIPKDRRLKAGSRPGLAPTLNGCSVRREGTIVGRNWQNGPVALSWLNDGTIDSVRSALTLVAPELSDGDIRLLAWIEQSNPLWHGGNAIVDNKLVAKFAWAQPAAERVWHEARILRVLGSYPALRTPRVVAASSDPALLVTEWVAGGPLTYEQVGRSGRPWLERTASELARFLADLHRPEILAGVAKEMGPMATPVPQATTDAIRQQLSPWLRSDQTALVTDWCDWADDLLQNPQVSVFVHGDLHGHNQVWDDRQELRAVVDFEESGPSEAAFDFRYLPSQGPTVNLFVATCAKYAEYSGIPVDVARVMAWNIRTVLGDAVWRSEAGNGSTHSAPASPIWVCPPHEGRPLTRTDSRPCDAL